MSRVHLKPWNISFCLVTVLLGTCEGFLLVRTPISTPLTVQSHIRAVSGAPLITGSSGRRRSCLSMARASMLQDNNAGPREIKGVLFDIDGTLCDSDPCHLAVFQDLLLKEGFNGGKVIDEDFFRKRIAGRQNALICADFFPDWNTEKASAWSAHKEAKFREYAAGKLEAMKGLNRLLDWIDANGIKKAAVTNAPRLNAEFILSDLKRLDWFDELIIGDECERAKPDPLPYQIAMQRLGLKPECTLVFEDSPSGARAGALSGAFTIGVLSSQTEASLTQAGCKLLIQDFNDPKLWSVLQGVPSSPLAS